MWDKFKKFSIKNKYLFQISGPISTIVASILFNFRRDDSKKPNDIPVGFNYEISIQFLWIFFLILAIISYLIFYFGLNHTKEENSELKNRIKDLEKSNVEISETQLQLEAEYESLRGNYNLFFDRMLSLIATNLNLGGKDRISVYFIPKDEEIFILKSRFSKNKTLTKKSNKNYSFKEGFIYKSIEDGGLIENIDANPDSLEEYISEVTSKCSITRERIIEMSMKSRSYYIRNIDEDTTETIGLIVLESLDINKFNEIDYNDTFNNYSTIIKEFISKHRDRFFSNLATSKGF